MKAPAATFDTDKLTKLVVLQREYLEKADAIAKEIAYILGGGAPIGALLTRLEAFFDTEWSRRYTRGVGGTYVWAVAKDRANIKRLLKSIAVDELEARITRYLQDEDPWLLKHRHPFDIFVRDVNRYAPPAPALELTSPAIECHHVPRCDSDQQHTRRRASELRAVTN